MIQKLFRFEVDQSIRIEELSNDTFLALANDESSFVVKLPIKAKRKLYEKFRCLGQPKKFAPKVFASLICCAIEQSGLKFSELIIDIEYPGYELLITNFLSTIFPEMLIYFSVIGKKSPAHYAAYGAHISKRKPDFSASDKDVKLL